MQIVLFFGLPVLLSVLVPRRWAGALLVTLALVWSVLFLDFSRVNAGFGDVFGMGLLSLLMVEMLVILGLRCGAHRHQTQLNPSGADQRGVRAYMWGLLALVSAVLLTTVVVQLSNAWWRTGWLTHLAVAICALAWWVVFPKVWRDKSLQTVWCLHPANVVRWVGVLVMALAVAWSWQSGQRVAQAAQEAAGGQAYCLLSATEDGLQPVTSVLDMAGFSMQAGRGAMRHAQMAIGSTQSPVWHYWSYRKASFVAEPMGGVLTCDLQTDYAARLPWVGGSRLLNSSNQSHQNDDTQFWLAGGQWRLPHEFIGHASDKPARISFYAHGKDFGPPQGALVRSGPQSWAQIAQNVSVTLCTPEKIHDWYQPGDAKHQVRTLDVAYGLARQETLTSANQVPRIEYVEMGTSGAPLTWIACDGPHASCRHAYVRDGMRIQFMHAAAELPDWKNLQDALWHRVRSFAVTWPEAATRSCALMP